ncbi:MAG TPA: hypothetical protein VGB65_10745 [Allosphingosinicella sp.]|jgi:hypothetical protein
MRKLLIAAVVLAQLGPCAASVQAAELAAGPQQQQTRMGAFAGARLRVTLGGKKQTVRAGLMAAPSVRSVRDGASSLRIGEGLEYGLSDRRPQPGLSFAGREIGSGKHLPDGKRQNVSTTGYIAIAAGVVLLSGLVFLGWLVHEGNQNTE